MRNRTADERPYFRYIDSKIPLLSKSKISSLQQPSVAAYSPVCEARKTGFLMAQLMSPRLFKVDFMSVNFGISCKIIVI